jgi:hypothetical protein
MARFVASGSRDRRLVDAQLFPNLVTSPGQRCEERESQTVPLSIVRLLRPDF